MCMVYETEFFILILFMLISSSVLPDLTALIFMVSRLASLQNSACFKAPNMSSPEMKVSVTGHVLQIF